MSGTCGTSSFCICIRRQCSECPHGYRRQRQPLGACTSTAFAQRPWRALGGRARWLFERGIDQNRKVKMCEYINLFIVRKDVVGHLSVSIYWDLSDKWWTGLELKCPGQSNFQKIALHGAIELESNHHCTSTCSSQYITCLQHQCPLMLMLQRCIKLSCQNPQAIIGTTKYHLYLAGSFPELKQSFEPVENSFGTVRCH